MNSDEPCVTFGQEVIYQPDTDIKQLLTPEYARRLADYHLALAQLYRKLAGLNPVPTASHQRKIANP